MNNKNYITILELKIIYELAKTLKCEIIKISNNCIYGTDCNFAHLKTIIDLDKLDIDLDIIFYIKDLADLLKNNEFINDSQSIYIFNHLQIHYEFLDSFNKLIENVYFYSIHIPTSYNNKDLKSNEDFIKINEMKSADGIGLLKLSNDYILTMFTGMLPVNKNDKLELLIKDIDEYRYLTEFIIDKKKFKINAYYMYLFLR